MHSLSAERCAKGSHRLNCWNSRQETKAGDLVSWETSVLQNLMPRFCFFLYLWNHFCHFRLEMDFPSCSGNALFDRSPLLYFTLCSFDLPVGRAPYLKPPVAGVDLWVISPPLSRNVQQCLHIGSSVGRTNEQFPGDDPIRFRLY